MRGTRKDYHTPTREEVETLVKKYLDAPQRESDGGFAEVPDGDEAELDALILALVKHRYEPDPDGDRPIRWQLCDWTRKQPHHFTNLPREEDDGSNLDNVLDVAILNLAHANEDVQRVQNLRRHLREES